MGRDGARTAIGALQTLSIADGTGVAEADDAMAMFTVSSDLTANADIMFRYTPREDSGDDFLEGTVQDVTQVSPSVSMGLREEGKFGESFLGMEEGGGIGFTNPNRYEISNKGEVLFAGTDQVQEWGMSGHLSYDSARDGLGEQLSVVC